jgi:hypothetical protein
LEQHQKKSEKEHQAAQQALLEMTQNFQESQIQSNSLKNL